MTTQKLSEETIFEAWVGNKKQNFDKLSEAYKFLQHLSAIREEPVPTRDYYHIIQVTVKKEWLDVIT